MAGRTAISPSPAEGAWPDVRIRSELLAPREQARPNANQRAASAACSDGLLRRVDAREWHRPRSPARHHLQRTPLPRAAVTTSDPCPRRRHARAGGRPVAHVVANATSRRACHSQLRRALPPPTPPPTDPRPPQRPPTPLRPPIGDLTREARVTSLLLSTGRRRDGDHGGRAGGMGARRGRPAAVACRRLEFTTHASSDSRCLNDDGLQVTRRLASAAFAPFCGLGGQLALVAPPHAAFDGRRLALDTVALGVRTSVTAADVMKRWRLQKPQQRPSTAARQHRASSRSALRA